jgi:CoB--CoM heterodisulfide reductase subunit B
MASYGYFWGCYIPGRLPHLEKATRAVFDRLGIDAIDLPDLTCCPEKTMVRNMSHRTWLLTAARNLAVAEEAGRDFVTPCTGCFGTLQGARAELLSDPRLHEEVNRELARVGRCYRGASAALHVLDVLHQDVGAGALRERVVYPMAGLKIAVHYGCHLLRPSDELLFDDPFWPVKLDQLVEALGADSVPYPSKMDCCGNLLLRAGEEEAAQQMCRGKLRDVMEAGADALTVVCPSCTMQYDHMQALLQRAGEPLGVPVFYYPELLGLALGLRPEELGLDRHRVDAGPFLEKWEARRAAVDEARQHWNYPLLRACAECGACVEDCPVARADPAFNPNELVAALAAGEIETVLNSPELWKCVECYTCAELCPNKYDQMTILRVAKHLALGRGRGPAAVREGFRTFRDKGRLTEASVAQRRRLGLPAVTPAPAEELRQLLDGRTEESRSRGVEESGAGEEEAR